MKWLDYLWPWKRRERIEEEKKADEQFRAQIAEAFLRQDDLREAAASMKRAREDQAAESRSFRRTLSSQS